MQDYRIFIIDDSRIQLILLEKALNRAGFSVDVFTDGHNLIKSLENTVPDLLISDVDMPDMDGFELIEEVENKFGGIEFPFFFISSSWSSAVENRAENIGAELLLEKPFKFDIIINEIETTLELTPKANRSI